MALNVKHHLTLNHLTRVKMKELKKFEDQLKSILIDIDSLIHTTDCEVSYQDISQEELDILKFKLVALSNARSQLNVNFKFS